MEPLDEYRLEKPPHPLQPPPASGAGHRLVLVLVPVLLALVAGVWWWLLRNPSPPGGAAPEAEAPAPEAAAGPLGPVVEPRDLPPLGDMDGIVRELLGALSRRPEVAAWLASGDLVRRFVASVDNVASGGSPVRHNRALAPQTPFQVARRGSRLVIDPASYARYDGLADTVAELDVHALARLYATLKPRLEEAYAELGQPAGTFDRAVELAIVHLLDTPAVPPDAPLAADTVSYRYREAEIEALSPAQKQLLRMGPRNVPVVQGTLRALARALGIPEERLPPRPGSTEARSSAARRRSTLREGGAGGRGAT